MAMTYHALDQCAQVLFRIELECAANDKPCCSSVRSGREVQRFVGELDLVLGQCVPAVACVVQQCEGGGECVAGCERKGIGGGAG